MFDAFRMERVASCSFLFSSGYSKVSEHFRTVLINHQWAFGGCKMFAAQATVVHVQRATKKVVGPVLNAQTTTG